MPVKLIQLDNQPIAGYALLKAARACGQTLATSKDGLECLKEGEPAEWVGKKIVFLGDPSLDTDGDHLWAAVWDPDFFENYHQDKNDLPRPCLGGYFPHFWIAVLS